MLKLGERSVMCIQDDASVLANHFSEDINLLLQFARALTFHFEVCSLQS